MALGQCRSGGITVATVAPAHGAEDVVPDNEISGGPPFDMGLTMSAPKKKSVKKNKASWVPHLEIQKHSSSQYRFIRGLQLWMYVWDCLI